MDLRENIKRILFEETQKNLCNTLNVNSIAEILRLLKKEKLNSKQIKNIKDSIERIKKGQKDLSSKLDKKYSDDEFIQKSKQYIINPPTTKEQLYYREIFETHYPNQAHVIPCFWMPKYCHATDASARQLDIYKQNMNTTSYRRNTLTIDVNI